MNEHLILGIFSCRLLLQALMGYFQIRNFARYHAVRQEGCVLIGKNAAFSARQSDADWLDHDDRIQEIRVMKGLTVFSRFREVRSI